MTNLAIPRLDLSAIPGGLHLFTDGCFEPGSGDGGWAFVVYRHGVEVAANSGGSGKATNNAMEIMAVLQAACWITANAADEPAVIWSDSLYAVRGCNSLLPIWKGNGWKRIDPNPRGRRRPIPDADIWKAVDRHLLQAPLISIDWCKGHVGIGGNERADALADEGRRSIRRQPRQS